MKAQDWDLRYQQTDLMWSEGPNELVEQVTADLLPGRALDLAAGEGRNSIWLAERGWQATAVDFSTVALDRATRIADERLGQHAARFTTEQADLLGYQTAPLAYDLVLVVYLHLEAAQRARVMRAAAAAVAPGGRLVVVAHDTENAERGYGGPPNPAVLYSAAEVTGDLAGAGLDIARAEQVTRKVATPDGDRQALDCLVVAIRPALAAMA